MSMCLIPETSWRVVSSIGPPRVVFGRRVGNVLDLELPKEIHFNLVREVGRYLYHSGSVEDKAAFVEWIKEWADVLT